jgi:nucleoside-diphosphate-sugar epimerase
MIEVLNTILGTQIDPIFVAPRPGDVRHSRAAVEKAREMLGYEPVVSFKEGLKRTVDWLRQSVESVQ